MGQQKVGGLKYDYFFTSFSRYILRCLPTLMAADSVLFLLMLKLKIFFIILNESTDVRRWELIHHANHLYTPEQQIFFLIFVFDISTQILLTRQTQVCIRSTLKCIQSIAQFCLLPILEY